MRPKGGTARRWRQINGRGFKPSDLVNAVAWWKAGTGVFTDTGATTPAVINDAIAAWRDQISNILVVTVQRHAQVSGVCRLIVKL
jgi:hypothetical protein